MIKIFDANDKDFSTAGNIIINPTKCLEYKKKSLNGWYIEVEIPIKYKDYIEKDKLCVVKTKSKLNPQAFRIGNDIKKTNRKISFTANHVMFDAEDYFLVDVRPTNQNGLNALNYINERTDNVSPFTIYSNVENVNTAYFIRKNLLEAWATIEERWNGVFDADNWNISFLQSVGHDNGESIIYGKNMQSMEIYEDWSSVVTRLYPVGSNELMLPEKYIESDVQYEKPYTKTVDFQTELEQEEQTEEALIEELRTNAENYIEENKYPKVSYTTKSDINDNMEIGDTIQVLHPLVTIKTEVLEYQYDIISKKIKSLTFGNFTRDVKAKFDNIKNTINQIGQTVSNQGMVIQQQTDLINSLNKNGYVYIDDNEILILDKIPKEEAENVWRFGLGGIGFSSNGYEGPFEVAITMDGQINADFITTGTMNVSRIEGLANIISDYNTQIASINLQLGQIQQQVSSIEEFSREATGTNEIHLEDTVSGEGYVLNLKIKGDSDKFIYLAPSDTLTPSNTLVPLGDHFTLVSDKQNRNSVSSDAQIIDVVLSEPLRSLNDVYDELNIVNGKTTVTRRVGVDENLELYVLENEIVENLQDITLKTFDNDTYIYIKEYEGLDYSSKYIIKSDYSDVFATQEGLQNAVVEMNSSITQTAEEINLEVSKKVGNDEIISKINQSAEEIQIDAEKISLDGKEINLTGDNIVINSNNFSVDRNGNMVCNGAQINNATIDNAQINDATIDNAQIDDATMRNVYIDRGTIKLGGVNEEAQVRFYILSDTSELHLTAENLFLEDEPNVNWCSFGFSADTNNRNENIPAFNLSKNGVQTIGNHDFLQSPSIRQTSSKKIKKNISKLKYSALNVIKKGDIYEYNLISDENKDKKKIGFVIDDNYNTPDEIIASDKKIQKKEMKKTEDLDKAIDLYAMSSIEWKAIQEQQEMIESLKSKINKLEEKLKSYEMDKENSQKANQNND